MLADGLALADQNDAIGEAVAGEHGRHVLEAHEGVGCLLLTDPLDEVRRDEGVVRATERHGAVDDRGDRVGERGVGGASRGDDRAAGAGVDLHGEIADHGAPVAFEHGRRAEILIDPVEVVGAGQPGGVGRYGFELGGVRRDFGLVAGVVGNLRRRVPAPPVDGDPGQLGAVHMRGVVLGGVVVVPELAECLPCEGGILVPDAVAGRGDIGQGGQEGRGGSVHLGGGDTLGEHPRCGHWTGTGRGRLGQGAGGSLRGQDGDGGVLDGRDGLGVTHGRCFLLRCGGFLRGQGGAGGRVGGQRDSGDGHESAVGDFGSV